MRRCSLVASVGATPFLILPAKGVRRTPFHWTVGEETRRDYPRVTALSLRRRSDRFAAMA